MSPNTVDYVDELNALLFRGCTPTVKPALVEGAYDFVKWVLGRFPGAIAPEVWILWVSDGTETPNLAERFGKPFLKGKRPRRSYSVWAEGSLSADSAIDGRAAEVGMFEIQRFGRLLGNSKPEAGFSLRSYTQERPVCFCTPKSLNLGV